MKVMTLLMLSMPMMAVGYDLHSPLFVPISERARPAGGDMAFVRDGKADFVIVVDKDAETRVKPNKADRSIAPAVKLICREFEKCLGVRIPVVDENDIEALAKVSYRLVVGDSKSAREQGVDVRKIPDQGFVVKSFSRGLVIAGSDSSLVPGYNAKTNLDKRGSSVGTLYGAIDFVNRFLGVAYFFPGEYGTYRPESRDLVISPVHYEDAPYFNLRGSRYYFSLMMSPRHRARWESFMGKISEDDFAYVRWRMGETNPTGGAHCPGPHWIAKEHPDKLKTIFYTSPAGKFWYHPTTYAGNYYNVVDLSFADLLIEDYARVLDSDGAWNFGDNRPINGRLTLQFGVTDVSMQPSEMKDHPIVRELGLMTEKDLAFGGDRAFSNIYGRFHQYLAQRVKERWPDAKLWLMPYYNCYYAATDPKWRLPDNVEINFCARDFPQYTRNPERMARTVEMMRDWYVALGNRPAQRVWLYGSRNNLSARAIMPEFIGEIPGICGKYLGREGGLFMDYDGTDLWHHYYASYVGVASQWNPDFDVDAAIDAHWDLFYGPKAGPHLRRFHRILKNCYIRYYVPSTDFYPQYPLAAIDEMEECLTKAESALEPDSVEMKRFRLVSAPWPEEFRTRRILAGYKPVVYEVRRAPSTGVRDDSFWNGCPVVKLFSPNDMNVDPVRRNDVKLAWDDSNVYLRLVAFYPPKAEEGRQLWENDTLEAFFCQGLGKEITYQLATDPNGMTFAQSIRMLPIPQPPDVTWRPKDLKFDVKKADQGWTCDITLPFSGMECERPSPGVEWNFNVVCSSKKDKVEVVGNSLTMMVHRNSLMYGILRFGN